MLRWEEERAEATPAANQRLRQWIIGGAATHRSRQIQSGGVNGWAHGGTVRTEGRGSKQGGEEKGTGNNKQGAAKWAA